MPKVSDYELSHSEDFSSFEKVRSRKNKITAVPKQAGKKKHREKKIDF